MKVDFPDPEDLTRIDFHEEEGVPIASVYGEENSQDICHGYLIEYNVDPGSSKAESEVRAFSYGDADDVYINNLLDEEDFWEGKREVGSVTVRIRDYNGEMGYEELDEKIFNKLSRYPDPFSREKIPRGRDID